MTARCSHCERRWSGTTQAHCTQCHRQFSGPTAFDRHRSHAPEWNCVDPATVLTKTTEEPVLIERPSVYGPVWGAAGERPEVAYA